MSRHVPNKLIHEKSPYLLGHAYDGIDWYPWGDEAFFIAQEEGKPVFLSIGYFTCHWGARREKEYVDDPTIAALLNNNFVNIKIDRDEHPDVSTIYYGLSQTFDDGIVDWPLSIFLTPDLAPFFVFTSYGVGGQRAPMSFSECVFHAKNLWYGPKRATLIEQSQEIMSAFASHVHTGGDELPEKKVLDDAASQLIELADPLFGGIQGIPKAPIGNQANALLRIGNLTGEGRAIYYVDVTLEMMRRGAIYDHIGGGFSCASIDEQWKIPHFEKMLYDNANAISSYLEAWKVTGKEAYRVVFMRTMDYILREMTYEHGAFFSACDADAVGFEGGFYTWTRKEVIDALGEEGGALFCSYYDITDVGDVNGRNIIYAALSEEEYAEKNGLDLELFLSSLSTSYTILQEVRNRRPHPLKDDKVLTTWNGMMINSMAQAGISCDDTRYLDAAEKAAHFIQRQMQEAGHLMRRWRDGRADFWGCLNDYAFMIRASLTLFECGRGTQWLEWAGHMTSLLEKEFRASDGAFYLTDGLDPRIIVQPCEYVDYAEPSGNAVHTENLLRLYQITRNPSYRAHAEGIMRAAEESLSSFPLGCDYHLIALMRYYDMGDAVVIALDENASLRNEICSIIGKAYHPHRVVIWKYDGDVDIFCGRMMRSFPEIVHYTPVEGKTAVYICRDGHCEKVLTSLTDIIAALE